MIKHIHLNECDSTQEVLKEQLNNSPVSECIVVSCETQNAGRGRGNNKWTSMPGTVCFSMNIEPHIVPSYTALEVSVILAKFFETKGKKIALKWPNDILNENRKKCAGVLIQGNQNYLITGVGINLFSKHEEFGAVFSSLINPDKRVWSGEMAEYINNNRYQNVEFLRQDWLTRCGHLNQMVQISEGAEVYEGVFQGIGLHGEAEVCIDGSIKHIFNGSLKILT